MKVINFIRTVLGAPFLIIGFVLVYIGTMIWGDFEY
jgi:hypothetical protein